MNQKSAPCISTSINRISVYIYHCLGLELAWILLFTFAFFHAWAFGNAIPHGPCIVHLATVLWANMFVFGFGSSTPIIWSIAIPLWGKCEVTTHTPENGTWESSRTLENSERNCKGPNTSHQNVLYIVGKVLKCKCLKWPHLSHLDIYSTNYG